MQDILSIIIVAVLGVIGNIIYFEYRLKGERHKEILKKRLTRLLLPLYYAFKDEEFSMPAWHRSEVSYQEYLSELPDRLRKDLSEIIKNNIYLADEELHKGCLEFIAWGYKQDEGERYEELMVAGFKENRDKALDSFKSLVYRKYEETKSQYLK